MKKILAVSGIRSEYDILYPILKAFEKEGFEVSIAVANAHLSDIHGNTYKKIESDGFRIADKIDCLLSTDRITQRSKGVGLLISALTQTAEREKPDFLLVLGDREESIATCVVGNYMDILTIHCGGGDPVYGNADDPIRFACSKLAHIHCTTAQQYAQNLLNIGEDSWRILCSGNTSYANIANTPHLSRQELSQFMNFDVAKNDYFVLLKHPLSSEVSEAYEQMKIAIQSCAEFAQNHNLKVVGIYPNTDPGSYKILEAITESEAQYPQVKFFKTLPREIFINLIRHALTLAGNSSMGILEAPFYKLPVVNIGNRQKGRLNAGNVRFVEHDKKEICSALQEACFNQDYRAKVAQLPNPYGDEKACERIVEFVKSIDTTQKRWYIKTQLCPESDSTME